MANKKLFLAMIMALLAATTKAESEEIIDEEPMDEEDWAVFEAQFESQKDKILEDLALAEYISEHSGDEDWDEGDDDSGRSFKIKASAAGNKVKEVGKNVKDLVKKKCDCDSHKVCGCCIKKAIKVPKTEIVFKPKLCGNVTIFPTEKKVGFNLLLGGVSLFKKKLSLKELKKQCVTLPKTDLSVCFKMKVTEDEQHGMRSCIKGEVDLKMFLQKFRFPCLNFKGGKLTADTEGFDEDEDGGLVLNVKGAYKGVKNLFGFGKKTTPPTNDDF